MWLLLIVPVIVIGTISVIGLLRGAPRLPGTDPAGLRTVATWRDPPFTAADVAGDVHELLRQLVGELAAQRFIFSSSIDRVRDRGEVRRTGGCACVDVKERRFDLRARPFGGGGWFLWIDEAGTAPGDSDDLRQLLTGLYRVLESRKAETVSWHHRDRVSDRGVPSPFYQD